MSPEGKGINILPNQGYSQSRSQYPISMTLLPQIPIKLSTHPLTPPKHASSHPSSPSPQ